jgi:Holliday junction DNA helicase RuvA
MPERVAASESDADASSAVDGNVLEDAYQALLTVGHSPGEARNRLDKVLANGKTFKTVEDILVAIYKQGD